jgi:hypothetical protein
MIFDNRLTLEGTQTSGFTNKDKEIANTASEQF